MKIIKEEMQKVEAFFEGRGKSETFMGNRDDWQDYRIYVKDVYKHEDKTLSWYFGDSRT